MVKMNLDNYVLDIKGQGKIRTRKIKYKEI